MNKNLKLLAVSLVFTLGGCMAEDDQTTKSTVAADLCDQINNTVYLSRALGEGGLTPDGVALMHWRVAFDDGAVVAMQSDVGIAGSYSCSGDEVLVTMSQSDASVVTFSSDLSQLSFHPWGEEPITYIKAEADTDNATCDLLSDNSYGGEYEREGVTTALLLEFDGFQNVVIRDGDRQTEGYFDCAFAETHIHTSADDITPMLVELSDSGEALTLMREGMKISLQKQRDPVACTQIYEPVCAIKRQNIQCVTTPCPVGVYKTYGNRCMAGLDKSVVAFDGECGDLEGEPAYEDGQACDDEYAPVCAGVQSTEPCQLMPCPAMTHKTFSNQCNAEAANALHLFEGECGNKEGAPVLEVTNMECTAQYDPVCAKDETGIACVTEPCETHEYRSFGNACTAGLARAAVAFDGECGSLAGTVTNPHPPVIKQMPLPKTGKTVMISNVQFDGDVLTLDLGYSGCSPQHFDAYFLPALLESIPEQVRVVFIPQVEDSCEAAWQSRFSYDLAPLRSWVNSVAPEKTDILIHDVGTFEF